jgi:hypothetical protein
MRIRESGPVLGVALLLGLWSAATMAAQGTGALAVKTVHGKVEMINPSVNAVAVIADDGHRMAWQFDEAVIEKLKAFKPGDAVVVIYRERGSDKLRTTNILSGGQAETTDACWCCAPAGRTCTPANKTGLGRAFLTRCYE